MALSLRFAEEADFSSRVVDVDRRQEPPQPLATALFRWSRAAREHLGATADAPVRVQKLVVALGGGPDRFLREFSADWHRVATLVVSSESIQPCRLQDSDVAACVVLSKHAPGDELFGSVFVVRVPVAIPAAASWVWAQALRQRVHALETFCLEAQPASAVFDSDESSGGERFPLLRALATSAVAKTAADASTEYPVRTLEVPRFTSGLSAALLTLAEVKNERACVLLTICDSATVPSEVVRCYAPLCALLGLDRPLFFRPTGSPADHQDEFNGLYT